jgi:hypothetical protein
MKRSIIDSLFDKFLTFVAAMLLMHALSPGTIVVPVQNALDAPPQQQAQPDDDDNPWAPFA